MQRTAVALTFAVAVIIAVLAAGAWEIRRLDHNLQAVRADVESGPKSDARVDRVLKSLSALTRETAKLQESSLRQEFYAPLYGIEAQLVVAVYTDTSECGPTKQLWQNYVNNTLIPFLNDPKNRAVKMAVRHDDPDYHATLLNGFSIPC